MRKLMVSASMLAAALAIAGCQAVQGAGPTMQGVADKSKEDLPYDVINLTPTTVTAYRAQPLPAPTAVSPAPAASASSHYTIGRDDVLDVHIVERYAGGIFVTLHGTDTLVVSRRVGSDGTIDVPFVGTVSAAGRDPHQIDDDILGRLAGKATDPQVIVGLKADRTNTVTVAGAVSRPGPQSLLTGPSTLVEAIDRAGGPVYQAGPAPAAGSSQGADRSGSSGSPRDTNLVPHIPGPGDGSGPTSAQILASGSRTTLLTPTPKQLGEASQMQVVVRRQGKVVLDKPYSEILRGQDMALQKGDEIVVSPNARVVTILGAVQKAGNVPIVKPGMTLADALGEASGLLPMRTDTTGVYVFRAPDSQYNPTSRGQVFRLNMLEPVSVFVAQQFAVHPRDVIYVTNSPMYEYDKVLTPAYRTFAIVNVAR